MVIFIEKSVQFITVATLSAATLSDKESNFAFTVKWVLVCLQNWQFFPVFVFRYALFDLGASAVWLTDLPCGWRKTKTLVQMSSVFGSMVIIDLAARQVLDTCGSGGWVWGCWCWLSIHWDVCQLTHKLADDKWFSVHYAKRTFRVVERKRHC